MNRTPPLEAAFSLVDRPAGETVLQIRVSAIVRLRHAAQAREP
jgi:hypothetical protein